MFTILKLHGLEWKQHAYKLFVAVFFGYNQYWPGGFRGFMSRSTRRLTGSVSDFNEYFSYCFMKHFTFVDHRKHAVAFHSSKMCK